MEKLEVVAVVSIVILSFFAIIGNTTIIALFFRVRSLQTTSNTFVVSLAFTDLLIGGILYPVQSLIDLKIVYDHQGCIIFICLFIIMSLMHVLIVLSLSFERFVTICKPMVYSTIITEKKCYITLVLIIVYSLLNGLPPFFSSFAVTSPMQECQVFTVLSKVYLLWLVINSIIPLLLIIIIFVKLFFVVRRHARVIRATEAASIGIAVNPIAANSRFKLKREAKSAVLLISIVVYFIITWSPLIVANLSKVDMNELFYMIIHFTLYSNTVATPFIYGFGNKLYRFAVIVIIVIVFFTVILPLPYTILLPRDYPTPFFG
ncbi:adenosine receptor A3-like [Anneissia japonica]|uniref:adenosine receptor A3-like n=1 Tax=Anneissia japonica TaxID=1529436 RepID=UPI0014259C8F|nr:adenosine receptor A3-like [Anneissia japonica]